MRAQVNLTDQPFLIEDTLRGFLARRCRRAYLHDLRNGLQGIHGGVDALTRAARKTTSVPLEQLTQFVQQAITNHERGLERVLDGFAPESAGPAAVVLNDLIFDVIKFVTNDAARNGARLKMNVAEALSVVVAAAKLRLILLGLLIDAIDALPSGGDIVISAQADENGVRISIADTRAAGTATSFIVAAIDELAPLLPARIDRKQTATAGCQVQLDLPG